MWVFQVLFSDLNDSKPEFFSGCDVLEKQARKSSRLVCILSPAFLDDKWEATKIQQHLKKLQSVRSPLICVALKELPKHLDSQPKDSQGETLATLLKKVHLVQWTRNNGRENIFWYALRLRLPPPSNKPSEKMSIIRQTSDNNIVLDVICKDNEKGKTEENKTNVVI